MKNFEQKLLRFLTPGPDLDLLVAEGIFEYHKEMKAERGIVHNGEPICLAGTAKTPVTCVRYSTDVRAAHQVFQWIQQQRAQVGGQMDLCWNDWSGYCIQPSCFVNISPQKDLCLMLYLAALVLRAEQVGEENKDRAGRIKNGRTGLRVQIIAELLTQVERQMKVFIKKYEDWSSGSLEAPTEWAALGLADDRELAEWKYNPRRFTEQYVTRRTA